MTLLLSTYLEKYALRPVFTEEEVEHYLMPVEDVVDSYVVEAAGQPMCLLTQSCASDDDLVTNHTYLSVLMVAHSQALQHDISCLVWAAEHIV